MLFHVVAAESSVRQSNIPGAYLVPSNWNDWFKFKTMYTLHIVVVVEGCTIVRGGAVKIGQKGMTGQTESPNLPSQFETLDDSFSIGQSEALP